MAIIDLSKMTTESRNTSSMELDRMSTLEIVSLMNNEDSKVPLAIKQHLGEIAKAADWCIESFKNDGRIIYLGAGTSGRLGVVDASECPPTFGVPSSMVVGLIAGGAPAFIKAVEGAEDSKELCKQNLKEINLTQRDTVIGLAASGRTPYVIGGLEYANNVGCKTVAISCNRNSAIGSVAKLAIEVEVGPEVLTGSTRLKAGTCQKLILNMISTSSMVGIGKCYKNLMVDVMQSNEKLHVRAQNIVMEVTGVSREAANLKLEESGGSVKKAIVMILADCSCDEAEKRLKEADGHVRSALIRG